MNAYARKGRVAACMAATAVVMLCCTWALGQTPGVTDTKIMLGSCSALEGPARNLVHALKYGGWRVAAAPMAECIRAAGGPRLERLDALVAVPLGATRLRERGHNQAALLAKALGAALDVPVLEGALRRTRETRTQTRLSPAGRRSNVAGAFAAEGPALPGLAVALVDDVLTTGATLGSAATALARQGPATIGAVTFARALVPA